MEYRNGSFEQFADRAWMMAVEPASVNVGLVAGDERAMLIDAGTVPEQGQQILALARSTCDVPVTHVILTHGHWDHWFGLAGMSDVTSIAHENVGEVTGDNARILDELGLHSAPQPDETLSVVKTLDLGNRYVELLHFGAAHTSSDVFVWIPEIAVCFTGDVLETDGDPQFDETSNPANWPTALDAMIGAAPPEGIFVPGHGPRIGREEAFEHIANLSMLYGQTQMLVQQGVKEADALDAADWPFSDETVKSALPLIYRHLEEQGVRPVTQLPIV